MTRLRGRAQRGHRVHASSPHGHWQVTTMIGASFAIGSGVEVFGRVTNLFNQSYEEALGYPALGRAAMIGVRVARSR